MEQDKQQIAPTWKWHKADWTGFRLALQYNPLRLPHTVTQKSCEKSPDELYKELDKAMKDNIPKTKTKIIDKNNPWWSTQLQNERKVLCKIHKTSLKHPTPRNIDRYKQKHNEYKKHCEKAKKVSWAEYKEKINSVEAANTFRKIVEGSTRHTLGTLEKTDGSITCLLYTSPSPRDLSTSRMPSSA